MRVRSAALLVLLAATACGGSKQVVGLRSQSPQPVATVTVSAPQSSLVAGKTETLSATLKDASGHVLTGRTVTWASSDTQVARVSSSGQASGLLPGSSTITATSGGKSGTAPLTVVAPTLQESSTGLTGYVSAAVNGNVPNDAYGYGWGYYSAVYSLSAEQAASEQLGWGFWIIPDNTTFGSPLCPVGSYARDNWPDRGPTWASVYQTIEGGMGEWATTHIPSGTPKFRINGTPDCYTNQVSSPAWSFSGSLLPDSTLDLAQLSNRVLVPPDGFTFTGGSSPSFIGMGWLALPLIPAYTSPVGVPTGDQSWTLFLRASNFTGPVAFYTPAGWSAINKNYPTGVGRGEDARPAWVGSAALEIGNLPVFTSQDSTGTHYARVPHLTFPVDGNGTAVLLEDVRAYDKAAIWDGIANWMQNGNAVTQINATGTTLPALSNGNLGVSIGGAPVASGAAFTGGVVTTAAGGQGIGMKWGGALTPGVFPQYFVEQDSSWQPIPASQVPRTTWLQDQQFAPEPLQTVPSVDTAASSRWSSAAWAAGPFTATLADGSTVQYVWYKFVDQPAIKALGLSSTELQNLQTFVDTLQAHSGLNGLAIPPPSAGALATMDPALFVTPPAGLEVGYVPIVIGQQ